MQVMQDLGDDDRQVRHGDSHNTHFDDDKLNGDIQDVQLFILPGAQVRQERLQLWHVPDINVYPLAQDVHTSILEHDVQVDGHN